MNFHHLKRLLLTFALLIATAVPMFAGNNLYNVSYTGPFTVTAGQSFNMNYYVQRSDWFGSWSALTFPIRSYISLDAKYDPGVDVLLHTRTINLPVNVAEQGGVTYGVTLPVLNMPGGRLYYITIVDPDNIIAEDNENDNIEIEPFYYIAPGTDAAVVEWANVNANYYSPEPMLAARFTLMNAGNNALTNLPYRVVVSTDTNDISASVYEKAYTIGSLTSNPYLYTRTEYINLDSLNLPTGKYFLFLQIDQYNILTETFETNNICVKSFQYSKLVTTTSTDIRMPVTGTDVIQTCNAVIYDNGGAASNYSNTSRGQMKIYPSEPNHKVVVRINQFATETNADVLYLYDLSQGSSSVKSYTGTLTPGPNEGYTVKGATGALDLYFYTDNSIVNSGFKVTIGCIYVDPNKATQSITFGSLAAKTMIDPDYALTATASSGLPVTYISSNPAVATITNGIVTLVGAGTTIITANQEGDAAYNSAEPVHQTLTVTKATQTITFNAFTGTTYVNDPAITLTGSSTSGLTVAYASSNPSVATVAGNVVTIVGYGFTNITASQPGNTQYSAASSIVRMLTVSRLTQTITFDALPAKVYGDAPFALVASSSSGLPVTFSSSNTSIASISGSTVTILSAGTVTITAQQSGNATYSNASQGRSLVISKAAQTITFGPIDSKKIGDPTFTLAATASSGLAVTYSSSNTSVATISGSTVTILGIGTTTITANQTGNVRYFAAPSVAQDFTVTKNDQIISFDAIPSAVYGDPDFTLNASASSGLVLTYTSSDPSVATVSGNTISIVGVGTTIITAIQAGNAIYHATSAEQAFIVSKATPTLTFDALSSKPYGSDDFELTASSSVNLPIVYLSSNPLVATIINGIVTIVGVGTTTITASQAGNELYSSVSVDKEFEVTKATQTLMFDPLSSKPYGSDDFELTASSSVNLPIVYSSSNPLVATVNNGIVTIVGVGTTTITASQTGNELYTSASVDQEFEVTKATQSITFGVLSSKTTESPDFTLEATSSAGLPVSYTSSDPSVAIVNNGVVTIIGSGTAIITAHQDGSDNYQAAEDVEQVLIVSIHENIEVSSSMASCKLYPVPSSDWLTLELQLLQSQFVKLELVELETGKTVSYTEQFMSTGMGELTLSTAHLSSNVYVAKIHCGDHVSSHKVVVVH